jgi:hypothetical protein
MAATQYAIGLCIRGLPDPTGTTTTVPVLFTNWHGNLSLPGAFAGYIQLQWLDLTSSPSGISVAGDIREPVTAAAPIQISMVDVDDALSAYFADDPGFQNTIFRDSVNPQILSTDTLIGFGYNGNAPTVGDILWIGQEAVRVDSVTTGSNPVITVNRGVCGSRVRAHEVRPDAYVPGDNGLTETLTLTSRPDWDAYHFEADVYLFEVVTGVATVRWHRQGYVQQRPTPSGDGRWEVVVEDVTKLVEEHSWQREQITLSRRVRVEKTNLESVGGVVDVAFNGLQALQVRLWLNRLEAETLFNVCIHKPGLPTLDQTLADDIFGNGGLMWQEANVQYRLDLEVGGHRYAYRLIEPDAAIDVTISQDNANNIDQDYLELYAQLIKFEPDTTIIDSATPETGLNPGLQPSTIGAINLPLLDGEDAPKASLRIGLNCSMVDAALYLVHSDRGDGTTDPTYDKIVGRVGCGLFTAQVNQGSAPPSALLASDDSDELLVLRELLPTIFDYVIDLKEDTMSDWLTNECRLQTLFALPKPSNGAWALRLWNKVDVTPITVQPLTGPDDLASPRERLEPMRAIIVDFGYDDITLEPAFAGMAIRSKGARPADVRQAQRVKVWLSGSQQTFQDFAEINLYRMVTSFFMQLQGQPIAYRIPTFIGDTAFEVGDIILWTEPSIAVPTPTGHGVTNLQMLVVSVEVDFATGRQMILALPDATNLVSASAGQIAPTLRVESIVSSGPTTITLEVTSVGETGPFDITSAHDNIWSELQAVTGRVRLVSYGFHNPVGQQERTPGWAEASGTVATIAFVAGVSRIELNIDASWIRGGLTISDLGSFAFVCLTDRRLPDSNVEGVIIEPIAEQLFDGGNGDDFLKFAPSTGLPFDQHFSKIG